MQKFDCPGHNERLGKGDEVVGKKDKEQGDGETPRHLSSFVLRNSFPNLLFPTLYLWLEACIFSPFSPSPFLSLLGLFWTAQTSHKARLCLSHPGNTSVHNVKAKKNTEKKALRRTFPSNLFCIFSKLWCPPSQGWALQFHADNHVSATLLCALNFKRLPSNIWGLCPCKPFQQMKKA